MNETAPQTPAPTAAPQRAGPYAFICARVGRMICLHTTNPKSGPQKPIWVPLDSIMGIDGHVVGDGAGAVPARGDFTGAIGVMFGYAPGAVVAIWPHQSGASAADLASDIAHAATQALAEQARTQYQAQETASAETLRQRIGETVDAMKDVAVCEECGLPMGVHALVCSKRQP